MINNLSQMLAYGEITVEELANAHELIERAKLVKQGLEACKRTLLFPLGIDTINCYSYMDRAGEYESWGEVNNKGVFTCHSNWGGSHIIGTCNLDEFSNVFLTFDNKEFAPDLKRFLQEQIEKAQNTP